MSTVGYGDIHPRDTLQRLYGILTMLLTPLIFGTTISLVTHAMQVFCDDKTAAKLGQAMQFMRIRGVPVDVQRRVQNNLRRNIRQELELAVAPELLRRLSPATQRELLLELLSDT